MKELIIQALENCMTKVNKGIPQTKRSYQFMSIKDVKPHELTQFMIDNNVPDDAEFDGSDNGYDGFDDIGLSWDIEVPTTDDDKISYVVNRFNSAAFKYVYDALTTNGYKRVGVNSGELRNFPNTVYDMYVNKDYDLLVRFYSLFFKL